MIKDLQLKWTKHPGQEYSDRQYLDYIVSGQPLREYLGISNKSNVTPFGYFRSGEEQKRTLQEFRLQRKTQLVGSRIELYICGCCGDIGCGSITAKIVDNGDKIVWTDFAYQNDPDEIGGQIQVEQIEFDRHIYYKAFSSAG
jgi:hypothetical protein